MRFLKNSNKGTAINFPYFSEFFTGKNKLNKETKINATIVSTFRKAIFRRKLNKIRKITSEKENTYKLYLKGQWKEGAYTSHSWNNWKRQVEDRREMCRREALLTAATRQRCMCKTMLVKNVEYEACSSVLMNLAIYFWILRGNFESFIYFSFAISSALV